MIVNVRLFGYLRRFCKQTSSKEIEFKFAIPENSTPRNLLELLGIQKEKEIMLVINPKEQEKVLLFQDISSTGKEIELRENDTIWIYPFLDGG